MSVIDIFGRPVLSSPFKGGGREGGLYADDGGWTIDVSTLPPGIYFISLLEDGKRVAGGKFVVAR